METVQLSKEAPRDRARVDDDHDMKKSYQDDETAPVSSMATSTKKHYHHHRGKRGRRRKSSSASYTEEAAAARPPSHNKQESPALQSIQDIIAEMKRLPTFRRPSTEEKPLRKSTRRHSEPSHQIKASTERLMSKAYDDNNDSFDHQSGGGIVNQGTNSSNADDIADIVEDEVQDDDHIYSHLKHPLDTSNITKSVAFPKRRLRSHSVSGQISSTSAPLSSSTSRRTLYPPHLPLPIATHLVQARELFAGTLAVDWQDSSDANVACEELGANIYIYGSRNRNRALDGDIVAVELVDVDAMLAEKQARKHARHHRSLSAISPAPPSLQSIPEHGPTCIQLSEEQRPAYCGKVVCILERPRRMLLSGTLSLHRPSSSSSQQQQQQEGTAAASSSPPPKIIWFVPADKRLPLVAIPIKHAPLNFVEYHQEYRNRIFIGTVQRWPATSLHPFGSIEREIGHMGELPVHSSALMADHHLKQNGFTPGVLKSVAAVPPIEDLLENRLDLRDLDVFTVNNAEYHAQDCAYSLKYVEKDVSEVGIHVADLATLVRSNTLLDREAKERAVTVKLVEREIPMFPPSFAEARANFADNVDRLALSVLCRITKTGTILHTWIGKTVVRSRSMLDADDDQEEYDPRLARLLDICRALRTRRTADDGIDPPSSYLKFDISSGTGYPQTMQRMSCKNASLLRELEIVAGQKVGQKISSKYPDQALLCRQEELKGNELAKLDIVREHFQDSGATGTLLGMVKKAASEIWEVDKREAVEHVLRSALPSPQYFCAGSMDISHYRHFTYGAPLYAEFCHPLHNYISVAVQRQLHAALKSGAGDNQRKQEHTYAKVARHCNLKRIARDAVYRASCALYTAAFVYSQKEIHQQAIVINMRPEHLTLYFPDYQLAQEITLDKDALPGGQATFDAATHTMEIDWERVAVRPTTASNNDDKVEEGNHEEGNNLIVDLDDHEEEEYVEDQTTMSLKFLSVIDVILSADMKVVRPKLQVVIVNPLHAAA